MRTLFVILSAVLFLQAVVTFFSFFSTPTDENWFRNGPTPFMAVKNFPAEPVRKQPAIGGHPLSVKTSVDSVLTGDLLLSINNGTVKTVRMFMKLSAEVRRMRSVLIYFVRRSILSSRSK